MSLLKGKKIALVGGAGFIGHHLAIELVKHKASVAIIDSLGVNNFLAFTSNEQELPYRDFYLQIINERLDIIHKTGVTLYVQDARDYGAMCQLVNKIQPHVIIHLAAVAHANISNKNPYTTFDHSLRTLENCLDCARGNAEHFIYFSSSMVYGNFPGEFVTEETPCEPIGIYGALKYSGEKIVIAYNQVFDLPFTIIRPSALYGERCVSRRVGQIFIENAIQSRNISINGDGSSKLDFTYIKDLVQGVVKVIENKASHNQIFNMTHGASRSLDDLLQTIKKHFPNIQVNYSPKDKLTPTRGTLSVDKAKNLLGYTPKYPIEKGFESYINWYLEKLKDKK